MTPRRRMAFTLIALAGLAVNGFLLFPVLPYIVHGDNDFMGFYTGAVLAGSGDLYNQNAVARVEAQHWEHPRTLAWVRLPFYATLISPLRFFSYQKAAWIWQSVSLFALILFIFIWPVQNRALAIAACCWSLPLLNCFIMAQDVTFVLLALALSIAAFVRGKHFAAGCLFSLCFIKYNLFLTIPLLILRKRLWKFGGGLVAGSVTLLAMCFVVAGRFWLRDYVATLLLPTTTPRFSGLPNLRGLFTNLPHGFVIEAAAVCLVLVAAWLAMSGRDIYPGIAAMLLSGFLLSYHAFFSDASVMVPVSLLLFQRAASALYHAVAIALLCPLVYLSLVLSQSPFHPAIAFLAALLILAIGESRRQPAESEVVAEAAVHIPATPEAAEAGLVNLPLV